MSQHRISVFTARAYVCSSLELQRNWKLSSGPFSRPGPVIPPWLWASSLTSSTKLIFDGLAASGLYWIGKWCFGRCVNRFLYVLVSLSQKDWVRKAWVHFIPVYAPNLTELRIQNRFHDYDLDELQYQFGSSDMVRSWATSITHTHTNPSSILTTGVLIAVRGFPRILPFLPCLILWLVLNPTFLYDLANIFLANG